MSTRCERVGQSGLRRLAVGVAAVALALGSTSAAAADCHAPVLRPAACLDNGTIDLRWASPDCLADTLRAHKGIYANPFFVSETATNNYIAIKLPASPPFTVLHSIRAYFLGESDVKPEDWSIHAAFSWSLHADSSGVPGGVVCPETLLLIGESDSLRLGGWHQSVVDWWLPDSVDGGLWLVGHWPPSARKTVRLGADRLPNPATVLAGMSDGAGTGWVAVEQGLLIEIGLLRSQPIGNESDSLPYGFRLMRQVASGPLAGRTDTTIIARGESFTWLDSVPVAGQILRYGVAPECSSASAVESWTTDLSVSGRLQVSLLPETLSTVLHSSHDTTLTLAVANQGSESLLVTLAPASLIKTNLTRAAASPAPILLIPDPDPFTLSPGESRDVSLSVQVSDLTAGTYEGWPIVRFEAADSHRTERRAAFVRLDVDLPTSVRDDQRSQPVGRSPLAVSTIHNPFANRIELRLETGSLPEKNTDALHSVSTGAAEVTVYNSLGAKVKHQMIQISPSRNGEGNHASVVIDGTGRWPSGVYLVSVRWNDQIATAKLLHLK